MDEYISGIVNSTCPTYDAERAPSNLATQRQLGAFYTCPDTAEHMANWAIRRRGTRVLEPSFGSGVFLGAARRVAQRKFHNDITIIGAELSPEEFSLAKLSLLRDRDVSYLGDFLQMPVTRVDAVIGNPPYVRLRHLPKKQAQIAHATAAESLGHAMESSGSVWMPFVLRCMEFLAQGGRMALVLPFELTYVKYARPLWQILAGKFSSITIVRVRQRIFPDILQDVVVLFADGYGGTTSDVQIELYETVPDLLSGITANSTTIPAQSLVSGARDYIKTHLKQPLQRLLATKLQLQTEALTTQCTFNIGYVSGHKEFFHPNKDAQIEWSLPRRSLVEALISGRSMSGGGLYTSELEPERIGKLFLPKPARLSHGERAYIEHGESKGVHSRYKCRVRSPWYVVPGVRAPDLILSVFAERPILMGNDAGLVATNSLLTGFIKPECSVGAFVAAWYTSLTLLGCEMQVHSLGGGVLVLIPGEVGRIRLPKCGEPSSAHLRKLDMALLNGDVALAYELGDEYILKKSMRLSNAEITLIKQGAHHLKLWRIARSLSSGK